MNKLIESIKKDEGFRGEVYQDHLGFDTVGYGTKMPLDRDEATLLLQHRLNKLIANLTMLKPIVKELPDEAAEILYEMSYQMGVTGVLTFKNMWAALDNRNYNLAADEMLDSKWANQTPRRAKAAADRMRNIKHNH